MEDKFKKYDLINNIAFVNLWGKSKEFEGIKLINFDYKKNSHLTVLHQASMVKTMYHYEIEVQAPWYIILLIRFKTHLKVKKLNSKTKYNIIDIQEFINYIEEAQQCKNIFEDIYNEYYSWRDTH